MASTSDPMSPEMMILSIMLSHILAPLRSPCKGFWLCSLSDVIGVENNQFVHFTGSAQTHFWHQVTDGQSSSYLIFSAMNEKQVGMWKVMSWNVRGLNTPAQRRAQDLDSGYSKLQMARKKN